MRNNKSFLIIAVLLNIAISWLITSLLLSFGNTLVNNDSWSSTKTKMERHVSLSQTYMCSRQALAQNRLNLGVWNGYQELIYKKPLSLKEIEFDYFLEKDSYLVFIFNKSNGYFDGIRISNYDLFSNLFFKANTKGKFLEKKGIENWRTNHDSWHHAKIVFEESKFSLFVDGHKRVAYSVDLNNEFFFGFRSGQNNVKIDNVVFTSRDGRVFTENFRNEKAGLLIFGVIFVALFLGLGMLRGIIKKREVEEKNIEFSLMSVQIVLLVVVVILGIYDSQYQQIRYPSRESLDEEENFFVSTEKEKRVKEIKSQYSVEAADDIYRIMLLGTSQTWGEGAEKEFDVIDQVIERKLSEVMNDGKTYQLINVGIRGETSKGLLELYEDEFIKFKPKLLLVNLSNNDSPAYPEDFKSNLKRFVDLNDAKGIKTVFIYEANSPEHRDELFLISVMRDVSLENKKLGINMNDYLQSKADAGFIWWDNVHLTSFGQELFAGKIVVELKVVIGK